MNSPLRLLRLNLIIFIQILSKIPVILKVIIMALFVGQLIVVTQKYLALQETLEKIEVIEEKHNNLMEQISQETQILN